MKFVRILIVNTILAVWVIQAMGADWTPPENPDPQTILNEAQADMRAKRYEIALAKHVWFHENALTINQAMSGVRLSFALMYWKNLGQEYPPAMDKLRQIRDELAAKAKGGKDIGNGFPDLAAINKTLEEDLKTTEAFKMLASKNPEAAKKAFFFVKPALIKDKEYALYVKYVDPMRDYLLMKHMYEMSTQMAKDPKFGSHMSDHAIKSFRNNTATLVAILAVNGRKLEAAEIATLAKKELEDPKFHEELEAALAVTVTVACSVEEVKGQNFTTSEGHFFTVDAKTEYVKGNKDGEAKATLADLKPGNHIEVQMEQGAKVVKKVIIR